MYKHLLLHLTLIEGIGPHVIQKIIERSDVQTSDLYAFSYADWMHTFGFTENVAFKIVNGLSDKKILEQELNLIAEHNVEWMTITDETYPALLKEIYLPPIVLYFHAHNMSVFKSKCLAVVGARKGNEYGQRVINSIVPDLVAAGYTIVSGGALGIDAMAHEAALKCGGKTIAVLGSGLLKPYPSANKKLFAAIVENGGIVASSFPLTMDSFPGNFPARNRIVTGLSRGCLVVQAAQKSGALISAHYAMEQGREVFAVPGYVDDELSAGCHQIIQEGAKLVVSSADILQEFGDRVVLPEKAVLEQQVLFADDFGKKYSTIQKHILRICKNPTSIEDIVVTTQLDLDVVQSELFNLQLDGTVEQDFTGMWVVNK